MVPSTIGPFSNDDSKSAMGFWIAPGTWRRTAARSSTVPTSWVTWGWATQEKKRAKESYPPPDRLPSSEYYSESDDSDDEGGDGNEKGKTVTLHEELHEELYGSTPTKSVDRAGSGDVAPTELENTPGGQTIDDSDDDDAMGKSTAEPSQSTTGAHKDQPHWSFWLAPHCCFLSWHFLSMICSSCQSLWLGVDKILGLPRQDTRPLTPEIAKLPDSSLQAQVFAQMHRMKSTNNLHADGLVQARRSVIHGGFSHV